MVSNWKDRLTRKVKSLHRQIAKSKDEEDVRTEVLEQVAEILTEVRTIRELTEIEQAIETAKGKLLPVPGKGFWEGKTPCWEMFRCPSAIRDKCPAFIYPSQPCWEMDETYCRRSNNGTKTTDDICQYCRVYRRWSDLVVLDTCGCSSEDNTN